MNIFEALTKEHQIFKRLLKILMRRLVEKDPASARAGIKETLETLLPALEAHEEIEEAVLGTAAYATEKKAREELEAAARGHKDLLAECAALKSAIRGSRGGSYHQLACMVHSFARALRGHLEFEEYRLWPHFRHSWPKIDLPRHATLASAIVQRVERMEREISRLEGGKSYA